MSGFPADKDLLSVDDVAGYLDVGRVTVYRWCREGRLPCLKVGKSWRVRREALEDFLHRSERPTTLTDRLGAFLEVPDNVIAIAQSLEVLHRLDAAFFRVGEACGGLLVKYAGGEPEASEDELRAELGRNGLEVARLEREERFRFVEEDDPSGGRARALRGLVADEAAKGEDRSVWASFDWTQRVGLDSALAQQEEMAELVHANRLVVKTAVLERTLDEWPSATLRRAQALHAGTIWASEHGLALSRFAPMPPTV